jgi:hypothetical protein
MVSIAQADGDCRVKADQERETSCLDAGLKARLYTTRAVIGFSAAC